MFGTSEGPTTQSGSMSWPSWKGRVSKVFLLEIVHELSRQIRTAPPNGFAKLATAVALILPFSVNHKSLYLVGAESTNGCASPMSICPNITTPYIPPPPLSSRALDPAYLIQFPTRMSPLATTIAGFGPPRFNVHITAGVATKKAKRKAVLSQFMAVSDTSK